MHRNKLHISLLAVSVLMAAAGSATAADLYAGGATFPAPAYVGDLYNSLSPKARLSRDAAITAPAVGFSVAGLGNSTGSKVPVFAKYRTLFPSDAVSYCQTGSGTGKKVLNNDTVFANGNCGDASSAAATGFTALSTTPDFIGTDSPISTADYNTFNTNMASTRTAIVQIPTIAGAIALPFKDNAATGLTSVALTTQQVCQIYSAQITDWADSRLGLTLSGSPHPITIVYRSEGSGTSFAFTSYLAAQCNGKFGVAAGYFKPDQSFAAAVTQAGSLPAYAAVSPQSGNSGVVSKVKTTTDALGYADIAEVLSQGVMYASVNGFDPAALPASISITPANLLSGQVLNGATTAAVPGSAPAAAKNCLRLVSPAAPISSAYPIVAITYVAGYYAGNPAANVTPIKNLFKLFYDTTNRPALPTGYAYVDGNALFRSSVVSSVNSCIN
ncbi:substrate-binding domain-containing protein [Lysobacter capsici]|uniref:substrate-binding domain-containing protein n=1 Tax=Lysobacter capsici TaxID=435897 RepID=UPI0012FE2F12|nr:substrate-binding domain-containing protein [Lysobacter capsici]UOF17225.1 substrate-binding domain-containing protein [Lysobacter capsici]